MGIFKVAATAALAFTGFAFAAPSQGLDKRYTTTHDNGVTYNVFEHAATGAKLEFVTNSGICETTAGVNQYSGYLSVGTNENMWFWFFEARNSPTTAPLATWFNGGPGCSSMIGLFQENGPCHFVNGASTPSLNPYSWNTNANMLYIDQPIGVGFSYGTNPVTSTVTAAPLVWKFLQAFYAQFPTYENRSLGIFTVSLVGSSLQNRANRFYRRVTVVITALSLPPTSRIRMPLLMPALSAVRSLISLLLVSTTAGSMLPCKRSSMSSTPTRTLTRSSSPPPNTLATRTPTQARVRLPSPSAPASPVPMLPALLLIPLATTLLKVLSLRPPISMSMMSASQATILILPRPTPLT